MPLPTHAAVSGDVTCITRAGIPPRTCRYAAQALTADHQLLQQSGIGRRRPSPAARTQVSLRNRRTDRRLSGAFSRNC